MIAKVIRHVVFRGRVQGVGFRDFVLEEAERLGLEGWVRNRADRVSVEAVFSGPGDVVAEVIKVSWKGPPAACVDALDQRDGTSDELALGQPGSFVRLSTV